MTHLALVRHGQTDWNVAKRIQGSTDIPLNDTGRREAAATAAILARTSWDGVLTSPLGRAGETAQIIADALQLPTPVVIDGLAERRYGEAEGLDSEELHRRFPGKASVPGRETHQQVRERVHAALIAAARERPGQRLIVVAHGGVISSLVRYATDGVRPRADERIPNGSIHYFSYGEGSAPGDGVVIGEGDAAGELRLEQFNGDQVRQPAREEGPEELQLTPPN